MPAQAWGCLFASAGLALWIDHALGEPPARWHPVVAMGRFLAVAGPRLARLSPLPGFIGGLLWWWLGALTVAAVAWGAQQWLRAWAGQGAVAAGAAVLMLGLLLKPLLAWRMLRQEVLAVEMALGESLAGARAQLARLVSRDVDRLSAVDVREAAIATLAENLNDSLVAPLCWFLVAGLPGAALYRFANTADAMWGYRDQREWSGKWAAWADDALSWLPARLTALMLAAAAGRWPGWRAVREAAARPPSPNSGWPMGTMALLLGCRLGKPGVYVVHPAGRAVAPGDVGLALHWCARVVWGLAALLLSLASVLIFQGVW